MARGVNDAVYVKTLNGCLDDLPSLNSRLVRIFISSTFTDTREERNVLLEDVYPKLKSHCKQKYGMDFQLVDMRWGVPIDAADDHQAASLCMDEIKNCQKLSTGPNFVTFLNQKHGFRPLQTSIRDSEFENLCLCLKESDRDISLLEKWYTKDCNQVPAVYVLQAVSTHIPGYKDRANTVAREEWNNVFTQMREDLKYASNLCHQKQLLTEEEKHKYFMSVTEEEIYNGILKLPETATDHCLCFIRIIEDITSHLSHQKAWRFIDINNERPECLDEEAQQILGQLRDDKLVKKLQNMNITRNMVRWSEKDGINRADHDDYLNAFKDSFVTSITAMIEKAVEKEQSLIQDDIYIEVLQHLNMANERCAMFHGRHEILEDITDYMRMATSNYLSSQANDVLVLYGQSGCGKTSIMAQTAKMVPTVLKDATVIVRFLGTSPDSSNLMRLLYSICQQITICYGRDRNTVPEEFDELKDYFLSAMKYAHAAKPLVILLDSLDQLSRDYNAYKLNWLPRKLPPNVYFMVSTYTDSTDLLGILRLAFQSGSFLPVPVFSQALSSQVVKAWLDKKHRTLTDKQFGLIEEAFKKCSLPLFVKLTYDQVISWRSYTPVDQCVLRSTIQQSIESLFIQLEKKHGPTLVTRALAYVTGSHSGISETELEDLLSLDDTVLTSVFQIHVPPLRRIPPLLWVRIRHDISQYLVDKEVDEVQSFFWYHRQFFETAAARYWSNKAFKQEIHSLMADYYLGTWYKVAKPFRYTPEQMKRVGVNSADGEADRKIAAQPLIYSQEKDGSKVRYNKRKLNKLPYHLYQANRQQELRSHCLFNYNWIQTKVKAVSFEEVVLDYSLFGEKNGILHKALKASKSTLKKFPETMAMEISGRLLAPLQSQTQKHEKKLLEESMQASARHCKLLPFIPCYNIPSESELHSIEHPKILANPKITSISKDSTHFAALAEDKSVLVWDLTSAEVEATATLPIEDKKQLNVFMKVLGKDLVIVGTSMQQTEHPVFVVNLNNAAIEHSLMLKKLYKVGFPDDLRYYVTDKLLFVHAMKRAADVFDLSTGELLHEFPDEPSLANFAADDTILVLQPKNTNMFNIYSMDSYECLKQVSCTGTPNSSYMDDSTKLCCIVMANSSMIEFMNLDPEGKSLGQITGKEDIGKPSILQILMQKEICIVTHLEGIVVYDLVSMKKLKDITIPNELKPTYKMLDFQTVVTQDNQYIVGAYDKHLAMWETKSGKLVHSIEATKSRITKIFMAPSDEFVITTNSRNSLITVWNVESLKTKAGGYQPLSMHNSARYLSVNRKGTVGVLRSMNSNEISVIDIIQGKKGVDLCQDYEVMMPTVTEDGKHAVTREYYRSENCLKIWNTTTGAMVSSVPVSCLYCKGYVLGDNSENIVVMTADDNNFHSVIFYNMPSATETGVKILLGKYNMFQIFFACDDKYLIIGFEEQAKPRVKIFARSYIVETGELLREYPRMHPKFVQPITPDSKHFMGHRIRVMENGEESWELAVINIETGEDLVTCSDPSSYVLSIGDIGHYGIDKDRWVFDIKRCIRCFQFDPECLNSKSTPVAQVTADEKYAVWVDSRACMVRIGDIPNRVIIGMAPTHSIIMNLEVTPQLTVVMGCEDGRIMMLQMVTEDWASSYKKVLTRSLKRGLQTADSALKRLTKKPQPNGSGNSQNQSTACVLI